MPTLTAARAPLGSVQIDESGCFAYCVAEALYALGATDLIGEDGLSAVDAITGRPRDTAMQSMLLARPLLQAGAQVTRYGVWDRARAVAEGPAYFRYLHELDGAEWTEDDEDYWDDETARACIADGDAMEVEVAGWPSSELTHLTRAGQSATLGDVATALDRGSLVIGLFENGETGTSHAGLLYGRDGDGFRLYWPGPENRPRLLSVDREWLDEMWLWAHSTYIIDRA